MAYNIPSKINSFNVYKDGTKLVGISDEVTLPDFESLTETLSGPGILGEVDDPTLGPLGCVRIAPDVLCVTNRLNKPRICGIVYGLRELNGNFKRPRYFGRG